MKKKLILLSLLVLLLVPVATIKAQESSAMPNIDAKSAITIDSENGQILFSYEADELVEVGSITKLLVAYVALTQAEDVNELIPVSDQAYKLSQDYDIGNVPLRQDYNYTVSELVESISINLANGSALALAEYYGGSEAGFIEMMNQQLVDWGLKGFNLINATGLPEGDSEETNAITAEVAAVIAYHLIKDYPVFVEYGQQSKAIFKPNTDDAIDMNNYNQMLKGKPYEYEGLLGLMPGSSKADGESFVGYAKLDDFGVITVVLGAPDEDERYVETAELLDYSFRAFMKEIVVSEGQSTSQVGRIPVQGGSASEVDLIYGEDMALVVPIIDTAPRLEYNFSIDEELFQGNDYLKAPIEKGQVIGYMAVNSVGIDQEFLPSTKGNYVPVVQAERLSEASWLGKGWQSLSNGVSNSWESTRRFFVDLFN